MNDVDRAIRLLDDGEVVGLPTETVYGLAADGTQAAAVSKIFKIKGRPSGHPLILHLGEASWLPRYCAGPWERAQRLASQFWPGPLTLILPRKAQTVPDEVTGGLDTVGVRVPDHPVAREVILGLGRPLAAPSANRFGGVSPTTKEHVLADLGQAVPLVLEGGPCRIGLESTIVDLSRESPYLLRPGAVSIVQLSEVLGETVLTDDGKGPAAPGTLASHYAPSARVVLVDADVLWPVALREARGCRVGVLALLGNEPPADFEGELYRVTGDLAQAAHELYAGLRFLDEQGCELILSPFAQLEGIGVAINDRLGRAAAPRS